MDMHAHGAHGTEVTPCRSSVHVVGRPCTSHTDSGQSALAGCEQSQPAFDEAIALAHE